MRVKRRPQYDEADEGAGADGLRTRHVDRDIETVPRTDWRLTDIEAPFRSLKSELGLRPICHQRDRRIAAHLRIAVLACHAVHLIRTRLTARASTSAGHRSATVLRSWVRITTRRRQTDATLIVKRQDTRPAAKGAEISSAAPKSGRDNLRPQAGNRVRHRPGAEVGRHVQDPVREMRSHAHRQPNLVD